jgi:hypothetical protein
LIHTILRAVCSKDDQTDDRAFGADDVAGIGPMFRKLRSLMIADNIDAAKLQTILSALLCFRRFAVISIGPRDALNFFR